jgi:voltage-gated potassium channel
VIVDRRLRVGLALIAMVLMTGTLGYTLIEGWSVLDSLFMTVITISTVGFAFVGGELSSAGKLFTIAVIATGVGSALYTAAVGLEEMVESLVGGQRVRRRMQNTIDSLANHVIVCGYGTVGAHTAQRLTEEGTPVVVVEGEAAIAEAARADEMLVVEGDATHDHVLQQAGLSRARAIVPAVQSDSDNLVITLSAKASRPDVLVVARATEAETIKKLGLAGADRVVAPQQVGAERLAALAARPEFTDLVDVVVGGFNVAYHLAELHVEAGSQIVGRSLRDLDVRNEYGVMVLAFGTRVEEMTLNPDPDRPLEEGMTMLAFGTAGQIDSLRILTARASSVADR